MAYFLYDYDVRPLKCDRKDYWDQVRRTVNGKPIPSEQINMMFELIDRELALKENDTLLDLCCGNGRLGSEFFDKISGYLGVDQSKCLIDIGINDFAIPPKYFFSHDGIVDYLNKEKQPEKFTKCLIYGSIQYLPEADMTSVFEILFRKFINIRRILISPIPDMDKAADFFTKSPLPDTEDHTSATGRWIERQQLKKVIEKIGYNCKTTDLPDHHYQKETRFSAIIDRP